MSIDPITGEEPVSDAEIQEEREAAIADQKHDQQIDREAWSE